MFLHRQKLKWVHLCTVVQIINVECRRKSSDKNSYELIPFLNDIKFSSYWTTQIIFAWQNILSTYTIKNVKLYNACVKCRISNTIGFNSGYIKINKNPRNSKNIKFKFAIFSIFYLIMNHRIICKYYLTYSDSFSIWILY